MTPRLVADRFLEVRPGEAIDLATGRTACVRTTRFAGRAEEAAWLGRCEALSRLCHPGLVRLADYGALDRRRGFEAWDCRPPLRRPGSGTRRRGGVPALVVPDEDARELACRLDDVLVGGVSGRPRACRLRLPGGARGAALVHLLARASRLRGYVPISPAFAAWARASVPRRPSWWTALRARHVLVLDVFDEGAHGRDAALLFLSLGLASDRPHVWLRLAAPAQVPGAGRVESGAGDSGPSGVREEAAAYAAAGAADRGRPLSGTGGDDPGGAAPGLPRLARACGAAAEAIERAASSGRHAQAERLLREWWGRFTRRRDDAAGGETALALGRLLLLRGRAADASRALEDARERFDRARLADEAAGAAVFVGLAWTDQGRFEPAEAAVRAAGIAAARLSIPSLEKFASLALVRCLYWQGRLPEAAECLAGLAPELYGAGAPGSLGDLCARERLDGALPDEGPSAWRGSPWPTGEIGPGVAGACLASRVALGMRDVERAWRSAAIARERAERTGDLAGLAAACAAKAAVACELGDVETVRRVVERGLDAARRAHAPLRALRLRIVLVEGLLRAGRDAEARRWIERLARLDPSRLPRVVSLPLERVIRGDRAPRACTAAAPQASAASHVLAESVVDILRACQSSDDEAAALATVTARLRERLGAASAACYGQLRDATILLASDGVEHRAEDAARRAVETGLVIAPAATPSGLEAAVPVRLAGGGLGALAFRFAADRPPEWTRIGELAATAAVAVGPSVRAALDRLALPNLPADAAVGEILGASGAITRLRQAVLKAAAVPFHVVIEGESGSGKELVARALHRLGPRRDRALCALNCAALTDELAEAELFGHARGAFTGAVAERKGLFEEADHGTLVLDEVAELTARAQAKLLRAIQEGEVRRIGENFSRPVDVRVVAATNRPLGQAVEAGAFRRDLLYRLEVIRIAVPPLRERREDIPLLAAHFWRQAASRVGSRCTLSPAALAALARYDWPGNVRELQNVMAALAVSVGRRGSVGPEQLPEAVGGLAPAPTAQTMASARRAFESGVVRAALARAGGRRAQAALELGLTRQGLAKLMARLGIE